MPAAMTDQAACGVNPPGLRLDGNGRRREPALRRPAAHSASLRVDGDLLFPLLRVGGFRQRDGQHALLEAGLDLVLIDAGRKLEGALERAEAALGPVVALLLLLLLLLLLSADRQHVIGDLHLD